MLFVTRLPTPHKIHNWISVGTKNSRAPVITLHVLHSKGSYAAAFGPGALLSLPPYGFLYVSRCSNIQALVSAPLYYTTLQMQHHNVLCCVVHLM